MYCVLITQINFAQPSGNVLDFAGTNDYVDLGNSSTLKPTTALTFELWAYNSDWASIDDQRFISNTQHGGYNLQAEDGLISGLVYYAYEYRRVSIEASSLTKGWHHFALTCNGRYTILYVDGELANSVSIGLTTSPIFYEHNNSTLLGAEASEGSASNGEYFAGRLDEVRIWNIFRTKDEIQSNMNIDIDASTSGLVGYWKLNETSGSTAFDATGNNNGILHNMYDNDWIKPFTTYYVKTDGNDSNSGKSWSGAKKTIQSAINASCDYDIILIKYGTYYPTGTIYVDYNRKITSDDGNGTCWEDAEPDNTECIIDAHNSNGNSIFVFYNESNSNYCKLRGVKITSQNLYSFDYGIYVLNNSKPTIENCWIYNNSSASGISIDKTSAVIKNNTIENNEYGVYIAEGNADIYNNNIENCTYGIRMQKVNSVTTNIYKNKIKNTTYGIYVDNRNNSQSTATMNIYNNFIYECSADGICMVTLTANIYNNTIVKCYKGIAAVDESTLYITNNIITNSTNYAIAYVGTNWFTKNYIYLKHNRFWENADTYYSPDILGKINSTYDDPEFVGEGENPYSLKNTSSCINKGYALTEAQIGNEDLLNSNRFYGGKVDLGAYELQENRVINLETIFPPDDSRIGNSVLEHLTLRFSGDVFAQGGNISLYAEGGNLVRQLASTHANVTISGNEVTVQLDETLDMNKQYYVQISNTALKFESDESFIGFNNNTDWNFSTTPTDGFSGNALDFDGIDDYVNCGNNAILNTTDATTIEAWIYYKGGESSPRIIDKYPAPTIFIKESNDLLSWYGKVGGSTEEFQFANSIIPRDEWTHIAVTYDGNNIKSYINGELEDSAAYTGSLSTTTNNLIIGNRSSADRSFEGKIDELRIWKIARNETQIRENIHKTLSQSENGLLGYWQMNESNGTNAADGFNGNNGTLVNMTDDDWVQSTIASGGGFSNTQAEIDETIGFTDTDLSINFTSHDSASITVTKINNSPNSSPPNNTFNEQYWVVNRFGRGSFNTNLAFTINENLIPQDESNPGQFKLYSRNSNSDGSWSLVASAASVDAAANTVTFNGITSFGQFIVSYSTKTPDDFPSNVLNFDGENDYVNCGNNTSLNTTSAITVEAWIYYEGGESFPRIIDRYPAPSIYIKESNNLLGWYGEVGGASLDFQFPNSTIPRNEWTHIVVTYDGNYIKSYINGELEDSEAYTGSLSTTTNNLILGNRSTADRTFKGKIDELRIWSIVRTEQEIKNNVHNVLSENESGLEAYYQFSASSGSSLADFSSNKIDGVLNNMENDDWVLSTAPFGSIGTLVQTQSSTKIGEIGKHLEATISTGSSNTNYLGTYCTGAGDGKVDNETFPSGVTQRLDMYWGVKEFGSVTADLVIDYTNLTNLTNQSALKLLRRSNVIGDWTDITDLATHNQVNHTFTLSDQTEFSEFSIGDGGENALTLTVLATVTTQAVSNITSTSARGNGTISDLGVPNPTAHGVCWNTTGTPTTADAVVDNESVSATGAFTAPMGSLTAGTLYYVRAYATNSEGTSYGGVESFTVKTPGLWTGATNSDWATGTNWDDGNVPTSSINVNIPSVSNDPVITETTAAEVNNLIVQSGGTLTIQSTATNNGSLIVNGTSSGDVTYNRYVTGVDKWHLISSPIVGQDINEFVLTNVATNAVAAIDPKYGLAPYGNTTSGWLHYTTSNIASAGSFTSGKGFEVLRTSDGILAFTGTVATDNVSIAITKNTNAWNLVGNPYLSALCANIPASTATSDTENLVLKNTDELDAGEYQAVYVWDANAATPDFITVNQSSGATYIAPGQAFFVYSKTGGGTFSFTEAMQTHQTGDIFKSGTIANPAIKLFAERSEGTSSTNIKFIEGQTTGLDPGYDGGRFSAGDNSFAVYTHLVGDSENNVDFDIQCLPFGEFNHVVPVGLNAPENTEVVFRAQTENLPADIPVYLEDRLTGKYTALHESGSFYAVTITEQSEGIGRFYLHTNSLATGISLLDTESVFTIIPRPQINSIRIIGIVNTKTQVAIYDVSGRQLSNSWLINPETNDIDMAGLNSGVYIVKISSLTQKTSKKISWIKTN